MARDFTNFKLFTIMKIIRFSIVMLFASVLFLSSCSYKDHPKKCNGKRGTRVEMGTI
jgi:hypothetical protein